jgi:hypothetical protein
VIRAGLEHIDEDVGVDRGDHAAEPPRISSTKVSVL